MDKMFAEYPVDKLRALGGESRSGAPESPSPKPPVSGQQAAEPPRRMPVRSKARNPGSAESTGDSAAGEAWAAAILRRNNEPVNRENIERVLQRHGKGPQGQTAPTPPSPSGELRRQILDREARIAELERQLLSEQDQRRAAESKHSEIARQAGLVESLRNELREYRAALAESRMKEHQLQKAVDSVGDVVRNNENFEREVDELRNQLRDSQRMIDSLSNRVDEARVEELLRNAEQNHMAEQRRLLQEARVRELTLREQIESLEQKLGEARASAPSAATQNESRKQAESEIKNLRESIQSLEIEKNNLQEALEEARSRIQALENANLHLETLLSELREKAGRIPAVSAPEITGEASSRNAEAESLRAEIARLSSQLADFTGFDHQPTLESRKILVECLESELARIATSRDKIRDQISTLQKSASGSGDSPAARQARVLLEMENGLVFRIETLRMLIAESLIFLRRKEWVA